VSERQPIENSSRVDPFHLVPTSFHNYSLEGKQIKNHKKQQAKSTRKVKHYISVVDSYDQIKEYENDSERSKLVNNNNYNDDAH